MLDGSINEKRKTLRIHLQKQDSEIVYLYKDIISPDARTFTVEEHKTTGRKGIEIYWMNLSEWILLVLNYVIL